MSQRTPGRTTQAAQARRLVLAQAGAGFMLVLMPALAALQPALAATPAETPPPEVQQALTQPRLQGLGQMRFFGLRVYEARLWLQGVGQPGQDWSQRPLALDIRYQRELDGEQIAERSLKEMRRSGDIDATTASRWLAQMKRLFPDVRENTRITGLQLPGQGLRFYVDGQLRGSVDEPEFARRFIGIWLSPQSSEPALRAALLGQAAS